MSIKKILNEKLEEYVLIAMMLLLVTLVVAQVFFRFVINYSIGWSEELARYLLIWIAWIAASYAVQQNAHIRVEIVKDLFSGAVKKVLELVVLVISFGFSIFLAYEGTNFILAIKMTGQTSPSLDLPMWIVYLAVPVGGTLMAIRLIQQMIIIIKSKPEDLQEKKHEEIA